MENNLVTFKLIPENKVIKRVRERYYEDQKGPESLDELCSFLSTTTKSKIFDEIVKNLHEVPHTCSIMTAAADDGGDTYVSVDENGIITGIHDVEMPNLRRYSMMFYPWIFEGTRVTYYIARIGMKYEKDENYLVLPYFVTLYAIMKAKELFDVKVINAAISMYICYLYSALTEGIANAREGMKFLLGVKDDINPIADITGLMKAVSLYEMYKDNSKELDKILDAVLDSSKPISKEFDFNMQKLDIHGEYTKECCKDFIKENVDCLMNVGDPDDYEPPKINFL